MKRRAPHPVSCPRTTVCDPALSSFLDELGPPNISGPMQAALNAAWAHAPYLRALARRRRESLLLLLAEGPDAVLASAIRRAAAGDEPLSGRLRRAKADLALGVALADLAGVWELEQVTRALSEFADAALHQAVLAASKERGGEDAQGLVLLALGKLGSFELNYSSDVDLIALFDPDRIPRRPREEPIDAAVRMTRRVLELVSKRDAEGYVFRVDLRLRPSPEATPVALPIEAAESYYQSEALAWERAAFIRARACAGDVAMGEAFLRSVRPFVWRRSLDFTAIREIQAISLRIRDHLEDGHALGPGFDLKRGRGGIREIEFFAQINQLVFGGRDPGLRAPATLDALAALARAGHLAADDAGMLADSYRFLRDLEHRVQMRNDEHTHQLPERAEDQRAFAAFSGFASWSALLQTASSVTHEVASRYDALIAEARPSSSSLPQEPGTLRRYFEERLPGDPGEFAAIVERWRAGLKALRSAEARQSFELVLPELIGGLAGGGDPRTALYRLDTFLRALPSGVQFFALLAANPKLVTLLGRLVSVSPLLADPLARSPELFDILLDREGFLPIPGVPALLGELRSLAPPSCTIEEVLDRVRRWTAERRLQIGAQVIEELLDPLDAAAHFSAIADAALLLLDEAVTADFGKVHGRVPGGRLVTLAFGRYGGCALTPRSDLDLVYLFSGSFDAQSDGRRPLSATRYFNRLAQRLTGALTVPTAAGTMYEVDTRLRPSGVQGLLAVSIDTFAAYEAEQAWTWELMALTRARVVVASPEDRAAVERVIAETLRRPIDPAVLRRDVIEMRAEMARHKAGEGCWDVKLSRGGLVDLEFIVHYLQLREKKGLYPNLRTALLELCSLGVADDALVGAHDLLTRLLVTSRLLVAQGSPAELAPAVQSLFARLLGLPSFSDVEPAVAAAYGAVREAWSTALGEADSARPSTRARTARRRPADRKEKG
jgi:glutamate-ammonia-ligase adenylyltransferase